ncbi:baseplate assembly protein [Pseudomonas abyssi]|uniref:Baseplate J-like central domain-containing protein n=1 Tax=Pseudomonas abyssi TaxID=170540 RepID=A0A395R2R9_9PSED|nr:baseplate J/gp47 family protein [Halopseudomonas gallaeciensis]RGP54414.1 hypothetical protein ASB58_11070 [Halopseudomonas gallaeciensis]
MSTFTGVDLSRLPPPNVIEALDFETILAAVVAYLQGIYPEWDALVESDPAYKVAQALAYRELILRQRINESARATMLAFAKDADLDHIGARYDVARLVVDPGDASAIPPIPATMEPNDDYRRRIQLSFEAFTTAGSTGSYIYHALSASGLVRDASATSPAPTQVTVYVLSRTADGQADEFLLAEVAAALNAEQVRPMTDLVTVMSASIVEYVIEAVITPYPGPDANLVREAALAQLQLYVSSMHRLGYDVTYSGVMAALHQPGAQRVQLVGATPAPDAQGRLLEISDAEAAFCTAVTITLAEVPDV